MVRMLVSQKELLMKLFNDLAQYVAFAKSEVSAKRLHNDNVDEYEMGFGMSTHRKNLEARLDLLTFISSSTNGMVSIEPEHLDQLYTCLLASTNLSCDGELFFIWLRKVLDNNNWIQFEHI